jgi:hypothetical protein
MQEGAQQQVDLKFNIINSQGRHMIEEEYYLLDNGNLIFESSRVVMIGVVILSYF